MGLKRLTLWGQHPPAGIHVDTGVSGMLDAGDLAGVHPCIHRGTRDSEPPGSLGNRDPRLGGSGHPRTFSPTLPRRRTLVKRVLDCRLRQPGQLGNLVQGVPLLELADQLASACPLFSRCPLMARLGVPCLRQGSKEVTVSRHARHPSAGEADERPLGRPRVSWVSWVSSNESRPLGTRVERGLRETEVSLTRRRSELTQLTQLTVDRCYNSTQTFTLARPLCKVCLKTSRKDRRMPQRVRVADLAAATGWTANRVRQQIWRGRIDAERDTDGSVWIAIGEAERVVRQVRAAREREAWAENALESV